MKNEKNKFSRKIFFKILLKLFNKIIMKNEKNIFLEKYFFKVLLKIF